MNDKILTRRRAVERIRAAVAPLYDEREALAVARTAVADLTGIAPAALLTDPEAEAAVADFDDVVRRLAAGCPVQYVTGRAEFYGRRFAVGPGVLIPRPETEELVHLVVGNERNARALLDVGCGSGCIAATLALELPGAEVAAADISPAALAVAEANCRALGARVAIRRADALAAERGEERTDAPGGLEETFPGPFDAIVSNPPYVPASDRATMHSNVRDHEPPEALFVPDDDPLRFYRAIARAGRRMLRPGGSLYFEIYHRAAEAMRRMLADEGYDRIRILDDLNGKPRIAWSRRP